MTSKMRGARVIRLEPFPLQHAAKRSMRWRLREGRRLSMVHWPRFQEGQRRYATVQLALVDRPAQYGWPRKHGWMLAYDGVPCTGPFDTRVKAISWFTGGGR